MTAISTATVGTRRESTHPTRPEAPHDRHRLPGSIAAHAARNVGASPEHQAAAMPTTTLVTTPPASSVSPLRTAEQPPRHRFTRQHLAAVIFCLALAHDSRARRKTKADGRSRARWIHP